MDGTKKVIVGIFVGGCLLLFGVGLFLIGNSNQLFSKSFKVYAEFSKITGIQNGGKVRVAGMDAGTVTAIEIPARPDGKFRIQVRVVEKLHPLVRQDSVATIQTDGLLGNKYLQIDAGTAASQVAQNESMIKSTEPFDWGDLMDQMNQTVKQVNGILLGVKDQLSATLAQIEEVAKTANGVINDSAPQVKSILISADMISRNLGAIMDGIQAGQGTMGALFKDKELAASVKRSVGKSEKIMDNLRETSASAQNVVKKVEESNIVPEVEASVKNLQQITRQLKDAVDKFQSASGEGGVGENLQRSLADAREAMADLSEDTEALKHNFLFRGYFKKRGFYDLSSLTTPEYRSPKFAKGFQKRRILLASADLFSSDAKGVEVLSAAGKAKLDEAMTELLALPRNGPLMIEGYTAQGTAAQQYLLGRSRAVRVKSYLIDRFHLRATYVGVVAMGAEAADGGQGGFRESVGIVAFYK